MHTILFYFIHFYNTTGNKPYPCLFICKQLQQIDCARGGGGRGADPPTKFLFFSKKFNRNSDKIFKTLYNNLTFKTKFRDTTH